MTTNVTAVDQWVAQQTVTNGDAADASTMLTVLQTSADRTEYLYQRQQQLADLTALKAVASPVDGMVRLVEGYGPYRYRTALGATAEASPMIVAPTVSPGSGKWQHMMSSIQGLASGFGALDDRAQPVINGSDPALDFPSFAAARSFERFVSSHHIMGITNGPISRTPSPNMNAVPSGGTHALLIPGFGLTIPYDASGNVTQVGHAYCIDAFLRDGCTLDSIDVLVNPFSQARAGLPAVMPCAGVFRRSYFDYPAQTALNSGTWVDDATALGTYNSDTVHTFNVPCDQNNVVDLSLYTYSVLVFAEASTNAKPNTEYPGIGLNMSNIDRMRMY